MDKEVVFALESLRDQAEAIRKHMANRMPADLVSAGVRSASGVAIGTALGNAERLVACLDSLIAEKS